MIAMGNIEGIQYGVGVPVDIPVALTYFEVREIIYNII